MEQNSKNEVVRLTVISVFEGIEITTKFVCKKGDEPVIEYDVKGASHYLPESDAKDYILKGFKGTEAFSKIEELMAKISIHY